VRSNNDICGFTLIELLVVVAIMSIMLGIFAFGINKAKVKIMDAKAIEEISQIGWAMNLYENKNHQYPSFLKVGPPGTKVSDVSSNILSPYLVEINGSSESINYWWYASADYKKYCIYAELISGENGKCFYFSSKLRGSTDKINGQCDCPTW